jgi:hypothetical protein
MRWKCSGSQLNSSQVHSFPASHESSTHTWNHSYNPLVLFFVFLLTFGLSNATVTSSDYISRMALYSSAQSAIQFEVTSCHFAIRNADWAAGWTADESKFHSREGQIFFFHPLSLDWLWDRSIFLLKGYRDKTAGGDKSTQSTVDIKKPQRYTNAWREVAREAKC